MRSPAGLRPYLSSHSHTSWPYQLAVQFLAVRFTLAEDDVGAGAHLPAWLYGDFASPNPPPPGRG